MERRGEFQAFFVGGPMNGTTMWMVDGTREWRFAKQPALESLARPNPSLDLRVAQIRCDRYERTHPMTHPFYRGCWIFEWMGEG